MEPFAKVCPRCGTRYDAAASFCQKDGAALRLLEEEADARIGQVLLGQFRIEERIGVGGMGAVYRARQTTLDRDVAIKILHPDLASNPDAVRRFHREARISTALDHPNVVRVFLFGQLPDGSLYLVMELLRGRTLAELLRVERPLPVHRALHIATQVGDGVGEAHAQGIVHRDVKPENVFLITKGRDPDFVKVLDFGIARVLRGDDATNATQSGLVFGTARYISPEGAAGERTDARSDVYSLGVLTYQLLCGETPFDAPSPVTLLMKHIHETPPHLKTRPGAAHVPDVIADVVMRALAKDPEARFEDATEFAEVLRTAAQAAGFDVMRMRRGSSALSPHGSDRRDPSGPWIRDPRASTVPRTVAMPELRADTLASAPSPFGATEDLSIPGVRRRSARRRSLVMVSIAFVVGAIAVASGAWAVRALTAREVVPDPSHELRHRAEVALAAGRYDAPADDSVLALTDQLLVLHPNDSDAIRIRRAAASRLVEEGALAEREGRRQDALDRYRRALALSDEVAAREGVERLTRSDQRTPRVPGIVFASPPIAGEPARFTATVADGVDITPEHRPRFVIRRAQRRVGGPLEAAAGESPGTFTGSFTFPSPGRYRLKFVAGNDESRYELSIEVDVGRAPRSPSPGGRWDAPTVTTLGATGPVQTGPPTVIEVAPQPQPSAPVVSAPIVRPVPAPQTVESPPPPIFPLVPSAPQQDEEPPPPPTPWRSGSH
jgi:serine/threonine-protein kinase